MSQHSKRILFAAQSIQCWGEHFQHPASKAVPFSNFLLNTPQSNSPVLEWGKMDITATIVNFILNFVNNLSYINCKFKRMEVKQQVPDTKGTLLGVLIGSHLWFSCLPRDRGGGKGGEKVGEWDGGRVGGREQYLLPGLNSMMQVFANLCKAIAV